MSAPPGRKPNFVGVDYIGAAKYDGERDVLDFNQHGGVVMYNGDAIDWGIPAKTSIEVDLRTDDLGCSKDQANGALLFYVPASNTEIY